MENLDIKLRMTQHQYYALLSASAKLDKSPGELIGDILCVYGCQLYNWMDNVYQGLDNNRKHHQEQNEKS